MSEAAPTGLPVIYWPPLDGWMALEIKQIRNPRAKQIIWMLPETWKALADHATRDGLFYIPCRSGFTENYELRTLVAEMEAKADGKPTS